MKYTEKQMISDWWDTLNTKHKQNIIQYMLNCKLSIKEIENNISFSDKKIFYELRNELDILKYKTKL